MTRNSKPTSHNAAPREGAPPRWLLAILHGVCPLLFFSNLTRNPYYTQIALLNICIAACGFWWALRAIRKNEWSLPRVATEIPSAAFFAVALVSTILSWLVHPSLRTGLG